MRHMNPLFFHFFSAHYHVWEREKVKCQSNTSVADNVVLHPRVIYWIGTITNVWSAAKSFSRYFWSTPAILLYFDVHVCECQHTCVTIEFRNWFVMLLYIRTKQKCIGVDVHMIKQQSVFAWVASETLSQLIASHIYLRFNLFLHYAESLTHRHTSVTSENTGKFFSLCI